MDRKKYLTAKCKVKNEPICNSQSISETTKTTTSNNGQTIKHKKQSIPISDNKRTNLSDDYPIKSKIIKEDSEILKTSNSHIESRTKEVEEPKSK